MRRSSLRCRQSVEGDGFTGDALIRFVPTVTAVLRSGSAIPHCTVNLVDELNTQP